MSLEDSIAKLTAAVEANTAALKAGGGKSSSGSSGKTDDKPAAGKHTKDEMIAAINEVNEKCGTPDAKKIIADATGSASGKMKDITDPAKIDEAYLAAKKALATKEDGGL